MKAIIKVNNGVEIEVLLAMYKHIGWAKPWEFVTDGAHKHLRTMPAYINTERWAVSAFAYGDNVIRFSDLCSELIRLGVNIDDYAE